MGCASQNPTGEKECLKEAEADIVDKWCGAVPSMGMKEWQIKSIYIFFEEEDRGIK